jgi:glycosyltransferase involved in cell wall biosynthesis
MHVVYGVITLDVGGLERAVVDLAGALAARHRVTVVCLGEPGQLAAAAEAAGAAVVALRKPPGRAPEFVATARDYLARLRPDVVHTHQIGALFHLGPASPVPVVHTEHGNHVRIARGWWRKLKARLVWRSAGRHAAQFCCVSDEIAAAVSRWGTVPRANVCVVPNGVATALFEGRDSAAARAAFDLPPAAPVVGTVGRLNEVKRQDMLLRAVAELSAAHPDLHALVVGDGPERENLKRLAAELGIAARVRWAGYRSDPEACYPAMNVFALTSRSEGFPVSLLEAWAAGRPVVCSAVGGIPSVVTHDRTGLLFPPGDLPALVAALNTLLTDRNAAAKLAAAGSQLVRERYSLDRVAREYERRYAAAIAGGR